jgi:mannose-6-phosphate isomerase-like protein (cupin superfamily)
LIRFHRLAELKDYDKLSDGVYASVISSTEGLIKIEELKNTFEIEHDSDVRYYIQKGHLILKLNKKSFLLTVGDSVLIPKCMKLKFLHSNYYVILVFLFYRQSI